MREDLLIRFSQNHPCWSRDLLFSAGEVLLLDENLDYLLTQGLLIKHDNLYCLSDAGRTVFEKISDELFLYERPGNEPKDFKRCALTTELWLELERCNLQKWGLKKYLFRPELNNFTPDLFLIINYDFEQYLDFKPPEQDELKLVNTDRFIFVIVNNININEELDVINKFYKFIIEQRLRLQGRFDLDCHDQDSATWLIFLTETQELAINLQRELKNFAFKFIELLRPAEIWTLSLESLRQCEAGRDVIWEIVPKFALPVCRDI